MSNLPTVTSNIPRDLRNFIDRLRDMINGGGTNKLVSAQDLVAAGIANLSNTGALSSATQETVVYATPPAPTSVATSAAIQNVIVTWDAPAYPGHAYAEVWGASTNNIGAAVVLGLAPGSIYTDPLGPSATRYYWVKFVNVQDVSGPFNAVAGTVATTGSDVAYLLDTLAGQITETELFADLNTRLNGIEANATAISTEATTRSNADGTINAKYTVKIDNGGHISGFGLIADSNNATPYAAFGIRANQFFIAPPAVVQATAPTTGLYAGYVWVDSSVTPNVTKYYDGSTWTTTPQALPFVVQASPTTINGVSVPAGVYMDAAYIKNGTISNAKIGNAAIDDAKIASLSATKINAGFLSADRIDANSITAGKIDSRGLSIKDASGNIILAAGSPLAAANITPAASWLNSNLSISSDGTLSGGGGGQVTISGLGYSGDLNATYGAVAGANLKDSSGTVLSDAAVKNSAISIAADGTLSGAGGGQVTYAGVGGKAMGLLEKLTTTNITTYIDAAAIDTALIKNAAITNVLIANAAITAAKIGDAEITNAKIANAAITAAKIGDAEITNAKIANAAITTAKIGDAQIETLKIAGNAVTVPAGGTLASTTTVYASTFQTVISTSIDSGGQPIFVTATLQYGLPVPGEGELISTQIRLTDGTTVFDTLDITNANLSGRVVLSSYIPSPGAGVKTYSIQTFGSGTTASWGVTFPGQKNHIFAIGTKR